MFIDSSDDRPRTEKNTCTQAILASPAAVVLGPSRVGERGGLGRFGERFGKILCTILWHPLIIVGFMCDRRLRSQKLTCNMAIFGRGPELLDTVPLHSVQGRQHARNVA